MAARIAESVTRDSSKFATPGTSVYLSTSTPVEMCLEISAFPSIAAVHGPRSLDFSSLHKEICQEFHWFAFLMLFSTF